MTDVAGVGSEGAPSAPDPWGGPDPWSNPQAAAGALGSAFGLGFGTDDHFPSDALLEPKERHDLTEHVAGDYKLSAAEHTALDAERGLANTAEETGAMHGPADARIAELEVHEQHAAARTVADTQAVDHYDQAHPGVHAAAQGVHDLGLDPAVQAAENLVSYGEQMVDTFMPTEQPDGG
jgi:hypothetical protein